MLRTLDPDRSGTVSFDHFLSMATAQSAPVSLPLSPGGGAGAGGAGSPSSPSAALLALSLDEGSDPKVEEFLKVLEEYRSKCETEGNYEEAARATDQLATLRKQEEARRIRAIKSRHAQEKAAVAAAHDSQVSDFNAAWDRYLAEFDAMSALYVKQLQERQQGKLREYQEQLHQDLTKRPVKHGRELLEWRAREQLLAK
jgi:hypothetical protein